ncbi:serine/threonine-protein kinase [Planosporangium mesophilum]|nr:serine/threonine-protein kinase [Planosporangium mesophilum]
MDAVGVLGGRYRLVERLGTGGMSVVWRAHDEVLNRQVAIKVLAAKLAADRHSRAMIRAEAQAAARLSHPHVTGVYDYGESVTGDGDTVPYVVMELISGRTLADRLRGGPLPWRAALRVGAEVAAALAAAHARGLVHRDVKPGNVMLTASGAKVVDFGIAAVAGESGEVGPAGVVLGTPAYLAPERLAGGPVRAATDVYGLGLLLYRALTGELPWAAETTTQMITAHVYVEPQRLPPIAGLPDGVVDLCRRCLAKNPADRPASREVASALAAAAGIRVPLPIRAGEPDDLALDPAPAVTASLAGRPPGRLRLAAAALFGPAIDSGAETSILPGSLMGSAVIDNLHRLRRRRAIQVVGVTAGLAAAGLTLSTCADLPNGRTATLAIAADEARTNRAPCTVRYLTRADNASQFNVDVTVTNSSSQTLDPWTMQFTFTGDQVLSEGSAGEWTQLPTGAVTVRGPAGDAPLQPGTSRSLSFSAGYHTANPMPTAFTLNGAACSYVLVGASGETRTGGPGTDDGSGVEAAGDRQGGNAPHRTGAGGQAVPAGVGPGVAGGGPAQAGSPDVDGPGGGAPGAGSPGAGSPGGGSPGGGEPGGGGPGATTPPTESTPTTDPTGGGGATPTPDPTPLDQPPPSPQSSVDPNASPGSAPGAAGGSSASGTSPTGGA